MTTTQVSVVIPVYNHGLYVKQAIESVLNQTYSNIQIIIIDDGSTDNSVDVIRSCIVNYSDRNIRFITQKNHGAHYTINKGLALATGHYLTILNSDDFYNIDRVEKMLKFIETSKSQIVFSYVKWVDSRGSELANDHHARAWYDNQIFREIAIQPSIGFALLSGNIAVTTGNFFFTKTLFKRLGGFRDFRLAHDLDFLMRALPYSEPALLREPLLNYRFHDQNTITKYASETESELSRIYGEYFLNVQSQEPENLMAPSYRNYPNLISNSPINHYLNRFYKSFYEQDQLDNQASVSLQATCNERILNTNFKYTLITHELSLSGAPKLVADLAASIKNQDAEVKVLALADGPMRAVLEQHGIRVKIIPSRFLSWHGTSHFISRRLRFVLLTAYLIKNTTARILVNSAACWPVFVSLRLLKNYKKVVLFIHESISPYSLAPQGKTHDFLDKLGREKIFDLWFGSAATRDVWRQLGFDGQVVYWSGISSHRILNPLKTSIRKILTVGSVCTRKGSHFLVDAFIQAVKKGRVPNDMELTLVGFPERLDLFLTDLILKILRSGFKDRIHMVPAQSPEKLESYFRVADLYVQPSIMECLPISLLQAMSMRIPTITTDVDGCVEAIQHGKNGYLCKSQNYAALEDAIAHAVQNSDEAQELAREAQRDFEKNFSLEATERKFLVALKNMG